MRTILLFIGIITVCATVAQSNCKKLKGKWRWIETSGGFAGMTITPESEAKEIKIEFTKKGMHNEWENGKLIYSRAYSVQKASKPFGELSEWIVHGSKKDMREQKQSEYFYFKGKDTLILNPGCPDCFTRVFVRSK